jgi:hypothetical protein
MNGNPRGLNQKDLEVVMGHRQSIQSTRGPILIGMVGRTVHGTECISVPSALWNELCSLKNFTVHPEEVRALKEARVRASKARSD